MNDESGFSGSADARRFIDDASRDICELIEADDMNARRSVDIHALAAIGDPLIAAASDADNYNHCGLDEIVQGVLREVYAAERYWLRVGPTDHYGTEQLRVYSELRGELEPIIADVDTRHLTSGRLTTAVECICDRVRDLRRTDAPIRATDCIEVEEIDPKAAVPSLVRIHELGARGKIEFETEVRTDKIILMDPRRFNGIIHNLVGNASKSVLKALFADPARKMGHIKTRVAEERSVRDGKAAQDYLTIRVADDGVGVDEGAARALFEKPSISPSGTGLGLWTVARLARWFHGFVQVHSAVGQGASVTVGLNFLMIGETPRKAK